MITLDVNAYIMANRKLMYAHPKFPEFTFYEATPHIRCADGFSFSVQAGHWVHCCPKTNEGPWTHFECGFPNEFEPLLYAYVAGDANEYTYEEFTQTVYNMVPLIVVEAVIAKHGGAALVN